MGRGFRVFRLPAREEFVYGVPDTVIPEGPLVVKTRFLQKYGEKEAELLQALAAEMAAADAPQEQYQRLGTAKA